MCLAHSRYWNYSYYRPREGPSCCSRFWVSSHYASPEDLLYYEDMHALGCEAAGVLPWET